MALHPMIEGAVSFCESEADDPRRGYNQAKRDGTQYDCSSLVCRALGKMGFGVPVPSFSTRSMGEWLKSHGFVWHDGLGGVQRGDIVWKTGHTAFATSSTRIVEACIDERGRTYGGQDGDQTGNEVRCCNLYNYNWAGYWRYTVQAEEEDMTPEQAKKLDAIYAEVTRKDDPSGRGISMTTHEHLKWMAGKQAEIADAIAKLGEQLAELTASLEAEQKADKTDK
jgi:hypothetical protein